MKEVAYFVLDGNIVYMERKRPEERPRERRTFFEIARKTGAAVVAGLALNYTCTADVATPSDYGAPWTQIINKDGVCPEGSTFGIVNYQGLGNTLNGIYSAKQAAEIMQPTQEEILQDIKDNIQREDICFMGSSYGTHYDVPKNAAELHDTIEKNHLDHMMIFAHSFSGIAAIDTLNEYHKQHPDSTVKFTLVFFSSPAEIDDLQPLQQTMTKTMNVLPVTDDFIQAYTFFSIMYKEQKVDNDVLDNTNIASNDTPATLVDDEVERFQTGMGRLPEGMDVDMYYVGDKHDGVVNVPRAIETIERRTGQKLKGVYLTKDIDPNFENHSCLWRPEDNGAFTGIIHEIIGKYRQTHSRDTPDSLAEHVYGTSVRFTAR